MVNISLKIQKRLQEGVKKFVPILSKAKTKDINESDTVTIIVDMLSEIFGYDKFSEITSEYAINKTFCDLAIQINGKIKILIECKAIGLELKDDYIRQATNYGAGEGIDWVILTNGHNWRIFKIIFAKPVTKELSYEFDLCNFNYKKAECLEMLYYLTREACSKTPLALEEFHMERQTLSKFSIGQLLLTETMIDSLRKTLKRVSPNIKVTNEALKAIIENEVLKREILENEKADDLKKRFNKLLKTPNKKVVLPKETNKN